MSTLFREEVVERRRQRLYGDVAIVDSRISSWFVWAIGILSIFLLSWAALARYPRTEQVVGTIVTTKPTAKIFAARPGVIERLYVREGQRVTKGQQIAYVAVDVRDGNQRGTADESLSAIGRQAESVKSQLTAERGIYRQEVQRLRHAETSALSEIESVDRQIAIQQKILDAAETEIEQIMPVVERGFISKFELQRRRQSLLGQQQQFQQLQQQHVQLKARVQELSAQLRRLPADHQKAMAGLSSQFEGINQQESRARVEVGYSIVAPITGSISGLQTAAGRAVDSRLPMLAIVPENAKFEAEVYAPTRATGFVTVGQRVRVMYDAFPYKRFGAFGGKISSVSHSIYAPAELDIPLTLEDPVYKIRIKLDRQFVRAFDRAQPLQSGMSLSAVIVLEERTFVDWLLEPLNAVRNRS